MPEEKNPRYKTVTAKDGTQYKIDTFSRPEDHTTDYTYGQQGLRFDRERDDNGRVIKETTTWPDGTKRETGYEYDEAGRLKSKTDIRPDGIKEVSSFDPNGKITKKKHPVGPADTLRGKLNTTKMEK